MAQVPTLEHASMQVGLSLPPLLRQTPRCPSGTGTPVTGTSVLRAFQRLRTAEAEDLSTLRSRRCSARAKVSFSSSAGEASANRSTSSGPVLGFV